MAWRGVRFVVAVAAVAVVSNPSGDLKFGLTVFCCRSSPSFAFYSIAALTNQPDSVLPLGNCLCKAFVRTDQFEVCMDSTHKYACQKLSGDWFRLAERKTPLRISQCEACMGSYHERSALRMRYTSGR